MKNKNEDKIIKRLDKNKPTDSDGIKVNRIRAWRKEG